MSAFAAVGAAMDAGTAVMQKGELPHRLSYRDAAFANFERKTFPMNVGSVGIYDGDIRFWRFLGHVNRRIQLVPRYRQRLAEVPFGVHFPAWVDDPHFDVRNHASSITLSPPGSDDQLARCAAEFFATPLRRDRPLWEIRLVRGLSGGRTAHLAKIHHCLVDGVGAIGLLSALLDTTPEGRPTRSYRRHDPRPLPGPLALATDALFDRALDQIRLSERVALALVEPQGPLKVARSVMRALWAAGPYLVVPAPPTPWRMRLHAPDRVAWQSLPFAEVRAVAAALGGTTNDVALTLVAGALRRYLEGQGVRTDGLVLRAGLPVNVRREEHTNSLGNRISFMLAGLPVGVRDPRECFRTIHKEMLGLMRRKEASGVEELMELLGDLPPVLHALTGHALLVPNLLTNLICTNVPGPRQPLYLQGRRMLHHYPWVPLGWRMGLGIAVSNYDAGLYFSVTADHETPGDLGVISQALHDVFDELREATGGSGYEDGEMVGATGFEPATS